MATEGWGEKEEGWTKCVPGLEPLYALVGKLRQGPKVFQRAPLCRMDLAWWAGSLRWACPGNTTGSCLDSEPLPDASLLSDILTHVPPHPCQTSTQPRPCWSPHYSYYLATPVPPCS